ncbi:peptidase M20 [Salmonella enterica subsp. enterica serovar Choleraesuis]|nr:peptidase M20 [Salmonella enterica subsp. enterica serovar Choleraesuis]
MDIKHYLSELATLVNVDCGTGTPEGVRAVAETLNAMWRDEGWHTEFQDFGPQVGPGLLATNSPQAEQFDVLLVGHMDTVFPVGTVAERPMSMDDSRVYGPGVSDMKSGLLSILWAIRSLPASHKERLKIAVAMNPDEETGSLHSHHWIEELALRSRAVLVCEAARADGSLVSARKGMAGYRLTFHGVAAHAGNEPEKGRSAITALAHAVLAINALAEPKLGTTLNVGVISGGSVANVVADRAEALIDVRFTSNDAFEAVQQRLNALCEQGFLEGVTCQLTRINHKPAMAVTPASEVLMKLVEQAGTDEGIGITWKAVGGGSDANHTAALGVPTLDGFGPAGAGFHSASEYLETSSIEPRIRLLRRVLEKM